MSPTEPAGPAVELPELLAPVRRRLVGRPLASEEHGDTLLRKLIALPVFASDPLSSVAYATEAALVVLIGASAAAGHLVLPISIAIAALLAVVVLSYRQTVRAYETSGGAYVVAKENLGTAPSLVAGAALLVDYILTVAVSVAAGVLAITSAAPSLTHLRVELSLGFIVLLTLANLRGVKEAGALFALPTYGFIAVLLAMIGTGIAKCALQTCPQATVPHPVAAGAGAIGVFVVLKAFASGSAALTGVEAISNGVTAFRPPQAKNAARTLTAMAVIAITLFLGVSWLAVRMHAHPSETVSVLSQLARATFPDGSAGSFLFYAIQALTFAILVLAANTSYQGFPRLAALMARDRFFPRQFVNLGDRLVYSNGIVALAGISAVLIVAFSANVDALIHLYVVGVFTAFTLSQFGMVRYWFRRKESGWQRSALINGIGGATTLVVTLIVVQTKFTSGAWAVVVAIPLLVLSFYGVRRHYRLVARQLNAGAAAVAAAPPPTNTVVLWVDELDDATREASWYAKSVAGRDFHPVYVRRGTQDPRGRWWDFSGGGTTLEVVRGEDGVREGLLEYLWGFPRGESSFVTLVVPEQFNRPSLLSAVGRTAFFLKLRLLGEPGVVVTDVPALAGATCPEPKRAVCRVLVSGGHAASMRALNYARTLGLDDTSAVFFAYDGEEARALKSEWARRGLDVPLDIFEAPYRDFGEPLLRYLRELTADPETVVSVVMPELVLTGWRRFLHNQRALYVKRLLLFEPRVILSSVPYQIR